MASPGDQGAVESLRRLVGQAGSGITVSLFKNNFTPTPASLPGDFVACDFAGYEAQASKKWTGPADDGDGVATMTSPPLTWVRTVDGTPQVVYGFRLSIGGTELAPAVQIICARRFAPPVALGKRGGTIEAQFTLTAVHSSELAGTALLIGCDVRLRVDQVRFRGPRRGLIQGMIRRLKQLANADGRAGDLAEQRAVPANLFFADDAASAAAAVVIRRHNEIFVR